MKTKKRCREYWWEIDLYKSEYTRLAKAAGVVLIDIYGGLGPDTDEEADRISKFIRKAIKEAIERKQQ